MRSKRYSLALMPYWVLAIAISMASQAASAARCDVDGDRDIDRIDIVSIRQAVGSPASGVNDPRDGDGDGRILRNDELLCALRCTLPLCELYPVTATPIAAPWPGTILPERPRTHRSASM